MSQTRSRTRHFSALAIFARASSPDQAAIGDDASWHTMNRLEADMSLEIAVLGTDGSPNQQVSIGVDDHSRLMQLVSRDAGSLLARLNDYYSDAEFENSELDRLVEEATALRTNCDEDGRLVAFLDALVQLAYAAKSEQKPLIVIAD